MDRVKTALGFVLLATAVWMLERVVAAPLVVLMWGALLLAVALTLWHEAKPQVDGVRPSRTPVQLVTRTVAAVAGLWGVRWCWALRAGRPIPGSRCNLPGRPWLLRR